MQPTALWQSTWPKGIASFPAYPLGLAPPFQLGKKGKERKGKATLALIRQKKSWHIKLSTKDYQGMRIIEFIPESSSWECLVMQISITMNHKYRHKKDKCNAMSPDAMVEEAKASCITSIRPYLELSLKIPFMCFMLH